MATKLIRLQDGILVEVEANAGEAQQVAGGFAEKVDATFGEIKDILLKTCQPVINSLKEVRNEVELEQVEVELGLSFEAGGDIYVAKATLGANLLVRMTLKNK
jgi:NTP-dependent ternary system trypsin peptidase co-occuring protein